MFSKESARHADACRFCWMCRHICPVAGSTGNEGWTPRARGLMVSMIERGTEYNGEIAEAMYHCTLCDACANDCATSYKPSTFIREARTIAVAEGFAPATVVKSIDTVMSCGNIFGETAAAIEPCCVKAETLLYVGQTANAKCASVAVSAAALLKKAGVCFTVLKNEPASGAYVAELMGFTGDVQEMAKKLDAAVKATGAKKLIVLNPLDAVIFKEQYKEWGLLDGVEVVTATAFIAELFETGKLTAAKAELKASLQEPVKLTRGLDEIAPAKALVKAAGIDFIELFLNGRMARCIGTVPFSEYAPEVVKQMVRVRCEDAIRLGSDCIVTASPDDYYIMKRFALEGIRVVDIFEILAGLC